METLAHLWPPVRLTSSISQAFQLVDTRNAELGFIALAQLYGTPYGAAAVETMKALSVWDTLQSKLVQGR
jgi:ABC-type molybdate transport system substrate-binding protein